MKGIGREMGSGHGVYTGIALEEMFGYKEKGCGSDFLLSSLSDGTVFGKENQELNLYGSSNQQANEATGDKQGDRQGEQATGVQNVSIFHHTTVAFEREKAILFISERASYCNVYVISLFTFPLFISRAMDVDGESYDADEEKLYTLSR